MPLPFVFIFSQKHKHFCVGSIFKHDLATHLKSTPSLHQLKWSSFQLQLPYMLTGSHVTLKERQIIAIWKEIAMPPNLSYVDHHESYHFLNLLFCLERERERERESC